MKSVMAQFERSVERLEEDANNSKQLDSADITLALTKPLRSTISYVDTRFLIEPGATGFASKQTSTILLLIIG